MEKTYKIAEFVADGDGVIQLQDLFMDFESYEIASEYIESFLAPGDYCVLEVIQK